VFISPRTTRILRRYTTLQRCINPMITRCGVIGPFSLIYCCTKLSSVISVSNNDFPHFFPLGPPVCCTHVTRPIVSYEIQHNNNIIYYYIWTRATHAQTCTYLPPSTYTLWSHDNKTTNVDLFFLWLTGPSAAGSAVQVYYRRIMWPDQGRVQFPASSVPHVSVLIRRAPLSCRS